MVLISSLNCKSPSKANIELRKQNQALREEIEGLKRRQTADAATIAALQRGGATVEQLPKSRLDQLFTAAGISLGKLTGPIDSDPSKPGIEAIRVQATPIDLDGQELKAAGAFFIEVLSDSQSSQPRKLGEWRFTPEQARGAWLGQAFQYGYLFTCPLSDSAEARTVTIKVTFTDALTERELFAERAIKVEE